MRSFLQLYQLHYQRAEEEKKLHTISEELNNKVLSERLMEQLEMLSTTTDISQNVGKLEVGGLVLYEDLTVDEEGLVTGYTQEIRVVTNLCIVTSSVSNLVYSLNTVVKVARETLYYSPEVFKLVCEGIDQGEDIRYRIPGKELTFAFIVPVLGRSQLPGRNAAVGGVIIELEGKRVSEHLGNKIPRRLLDLIPRK